TVALPRQHRQTYAGGGARPPRGPGGGGYRQAATACDVGRCCLSANGLSAPLVSRAYRASLHRDMALFPYGPRNWLLNPKRLLLALLRCLWFEARLAAWGETFQPYPWREGLRLDWRFAEGAKLELARQRAKAGIEDGRGKGGKEWRIRLHQARPLK